MEVMLLAEVTRESQRRKNDHHSFEFRKTPGLLPQPVRRISLATVPTKRKIRGAIMPGVRRRRECSHATVNFP
jgi:hypothetical protein